MALHLRLISGGDMTVQAGRPAPHDIVVQVLDGDNPAPGKWVTFIAEPPSAVLFDGAMHSVPKSNEQGIVTVKPFGNLLGAHRVVASLPGGGDRHDGQYLDISITVEEDDLGIKTLPNGQQLAVYKPRRTASPPPPRPRGPIGWPTATMVLGVMAILLIGAWLLFGRNSSAEPMSPPYSGGERITMEVPREITDALAQTRADQAAQTREMAALNEAILRMDDDLNQRIARTGLAGRVYTDERLRLRQLYERMRPEMDAYEASLGPRVEGYHQRYGMTADLRTICAKFPFICKRIEEDG